MSPLLPGKPAPDFTAKAVVKGAIIDNFSLKEFSGQYVVLFFYPLDFTFVCPTELHAFQARLADFQARDTQLIGCSVDSWFSHAAWLNTPRSEGGIQGVEYPLVSDLNKSIAKAYGVLQEEAGLAYRGLFLIDPQGIIRHLLINDLPLGRSVDEVLRTLDALRYVEQHGEVCPANWKEGTQAMTPTTEGLRNYFNA